MKKISNIVLQAKHWQMFLCFIIPLIIQMFVMFKIMGSIDISHVENPEVIFEKMKYVQIISIFPFIILYSWFLSIGFRFTSEISWLKQMKVKKFVLLLIFPIIYMMIAFSLFELTASFPLLALVLVPLHFTAMFGMIYSWYFPSRVLASIKLKRIATRGEAIGNLFLMWIFPIGIWVLQPEVNKAFREFCLSDSDELSE